MKGKSWVGTILLGIFIFLAHYSVPFMMDDEWYSTNLATGAPLKSFSDVLEGQVWHYLNWGGRSVTHGILQLTLMTGELCADILNVMMTFLLAYMICVIAKQRNVRCFLLSLSLLIALNANTKMSMFWQSGLVNYVYSSVWILLFLWPYLNAADKLKEQAEEEAGEKFRVWYTMGMLPLGLMTGWSNENMGPTCFVIAVLVILYRKFVLRKKIPLWMYTGGLTSFIGSVMVVVAPGNFVRSNAIEDKGVLLTLQERFFSMFQAGMDFLFPTCMLVAVLLLVWVCYYKEKLSISQILLLLGMILSYSAMVLSPHYPDRATFGTMVWGIILIDTLLAGILKKAPAMGKYVNILQLCVWGYSLLVLVDIMQNTGILS